MCLLALRILVYVSRTLAGLFIYLFRGWILCLTYGACPGGILHICCAQEWKVCWRWGKNVSPPTHLWGCGRVRNLFKERDASQAHAVTSSRGGQNKKTQDAVRDASQQMQSAEDRRRKHICGCIFYKILKKTLLRQIMERPRVINGYEWIAVYPCRWLHHPWVPLSLFQWFCPGYQRA